MRLLLRGGGGGGNGGGGNGGAGGGTAACACVELLRRQAAEGCADAGEDMACCSTIPEVFAKPVCRPSATCPRTCKAATDCNSPAGEVCCNGYCAATCPKDCFQAVDCNTAQGETCCKLAVEYQTLFKLQGAQ